MRPHGLHYDVNCSILFTELPLLERPAAARAAGFGAVEFWWPFPEAVPSSAAVEAFASAVESAGVELAGLNFFAGDMAAGDRGVLSWPARAREFRDLGGLAGWHQNTTFDQRVVRIDASAAHFQRNVLSEGSSCQGA